MNEEEIMFDRRVKGMGYTILGLLLCFVLLYTITNGYFDNFKQLRQPDELKATSTSSGSVNEYTTGNSAIGEQLFKTNCNQCHLPNVDATGPALQGAKERWIKNSTGENFYKWVQNSTSLRNSGDPYANKLYKNWNNQPMPAFNLSKEEIDEIFIYIN